MAEAPKGVRLNKYVADAGVCSRREADKLIAAGEVTVNGEVVTEMGVRVGPEDDVHYNGKLLRKEKYQYVILNKPRNYITTVSDTHDRKTVMDLVKDACPERIYPVGRLDRNTTGLLLLTNDGELAKRLTHPSYGVVKTYLVDLDRPLEEYDRLAQLEGLELEDGNQAFDDIKFDRDGNRQRVIVKLHSGKNRIVRRMFAYLDYNVQALDRIGFAGLKKGNLTRSKWRNLTEKEIGFLKMAKVDP